DHRAGCRRVPPECFHGRYPENFPPPSGERRVDRTSAGPGASGSATALALEPLLPANQLTDPVEGSLVALLAMQPIRKWQRSDATRPAHAAVASNTRNATVARSRRRRWGLT